MRFSRSSTTGQIKEIREAAEERDAARRAKKEDIPYLQEDIMPGKDALLILPQESARAAGLGHRTASLSAGDSSVKSIRNPRILQQFE